jgi:hypothetical protein
VFLDIPFRAQGNPLILLDIEGRSVDALEALEGILLHKGIHLGLF